MPWTERQVAMLREMGLPVWQRHALSPAPEDGPDPGEPAAAEPLRRDNASGVRPRAGGTGTVPDRAARASAAVEPTDADRAELATAAPREAVAGMDWSALRASVDTCRACALGTTRKHAVFGVGHERAHWMIVGEAPGEQEDLKGEPFVGKAGQLLDNMLRAVGLTRADAPPERQVYIANTLKCRPPGNRNPQPEELVKCEPFLIRQIELVQPRIILAMGRFAVQSLLRSSEAIGRLRGRVHRYQGVPLVVTYHPAYLLRNPLDKARAWEDLRLALRVLSDATSS